MASGAGFLTRVLRIWMPLLPPALINGFLFVFILSFKIMSIATLLQSSDNMVLAVFLWRLWDTGDSGQAAALAVLMIVVLGTLTSLARYFTRSTSAFKEISDESG